MDKMQGCGPCDYRSDSCRGHCFAKASQCRHCDIVDLYNVIFVIPREAVPFEAFGIVG